MVVHNYKLASFEEIKQLLTKGHDNIEPFLFREKLYVFDENGQRIGRFSLSIDQDDQSENPFLYVHISNRAYIDGRLSETTVTGTITKKLKTLEEIRYECTQVSETEKHERSTFLLREATKYYLSVTNTICEMKTQKHWTISFAEALGLMSESSNALLLRVLARKGFEGIFCLRTYLSNGIRCKNYYVSKLSEQMVNGKKMQVLIVYRNITNHKKCNVTMTMALTRADIEMYTNAYTKTEPKLMNHWHKDIQMHSLYRDQVDHQLTLSRSLKYRKEQVRRLLGDFIEYILFMKPEDPICFAIQYFSAFARGSVKKCHTRTKETLEDIHLGEDYSEEMMGENFQFWMGEGGFFYEP